jgi:hypothetical protein
MYFLLVPFVERRSKDLYQNLKLQDPRHPEKRPAGAPEPRIP